MSTQAPTKPLPCLQTTEPPPVPETPFSVASDPAPSDLDAPTWMRQRAAQAVTSKGDPGTFAEPRLSLVISPTLAAAPRVGSLVEQLRGCCTSLGLKIEVTIHF
jgi:hypothetical protein